MKIAIFDFDGTLVDVETLPLLVKTWVALGYPKRKQQIVISKVLAKLVKYKNPLFKKYEKQKFRDEAMHIFLGIFKGMDKTEIDQYFSDSVQFLEEKYCPWVVKEIQRVQEEGYTTVLLTGGFRPLVERVGEIYNFDYVIGSEIHYNDQEQIDYNNPTELIMGAKKLAKIKTVLGHIDINWEDSIAFADSYYDVDLLALVGTAVAVNPDDKLEAIAKEKMWKIIKG